MLDSGTLLNPVTLSPFVPDHHHSQFSPELAALTYSVAHHCLLPSYFSQINIIGQEHLPLDGPVILAPTHRSRWDALIVPYATGRLVTGRDLRYMVTADEMKGLQGWFIRKMGGFAVNPRQPAIASLRHGVNLLRQGEMVVIFPEGNIFRDYQVHRLKSGLARLALQAQSHCPHTAVKIVPIALRYHPTVPRWGCQVSVKIGAPLLVPDYRYTTPKREAQRLTQDLHQTLQQLDQDNSVLLRLNPEQSESDLMAG